MSQTRNINILCLIAAIMLVLILPRNKELWYDETISVLCSKGISHDAPHLFDNTTVVHSETINELNTAGNVFAATVNDNANSYIYNITLHWFTGITGNSVGSYMLFSKLLAITVLISFYFLCNLFFRNNLFTSLALLLLVTDIDFIGMSHEIRAYTMGILFVTLAAIYFYKFMYDDQEKALYLFLTGLFSVGAVLSHFLSVYIILAFLGAMVLRKKTALLKPKNLAAMAVPVALIALFFAMAYPGLQTMSKQNHEIQQKTMAAGFNVAEVFFRALKFTAINMKVVFPSFVGSRPVIAFSFLLVAGLYFLGIKSATNKVQRRNIHLLFVLGAGSSLFLAVLCLKSHHYTALYYRYFSFCLPFCSLFVCYVIYVLYQNTRINKMLVALRASILIIPSLVLFGTSIKNASVKVKYNHAAIAQKIVADNIEKIEVPEWKDAFLINSLLPKGQKLDYIRNKDAGSFTLYKGGTAEQITVIRIDE